MKKTLVDERLTVTLLADSHCCWAEIPAAGIEPAPLKLPDGREIRPGDRVTRLGGRKTSAGYTTVRMIEPGFLVYRGENRSLDGTLVVFDTEPAQSHRVVFWRHGFNLYHFTPACSGRLVELTDVHFTPAP